MQHYMKKRTITTDYFFWFRIMHGFTLVELLVTIGIISILASILLPALQTARNNAMVISCLSSIKQSALGVHNYAVDFDNYAPWFGQAPANSPPVGSHRFDIFLRKYYGKTLVDPGYWPAGILTCPARPVRPGNISTAPNSLYYWDTSKYVVNGTPDIPAGTVITSSYFLKPTSDAKFNDYWTYAGSTAVGRWGWRLNKNPGGMLLTDLYNDMQTGPWRNYHKRKLVTAFEDGSASNEPYLVPMNLSNRWTEDGVRDFCTRLDRNNESRNWR